MHLSNMQYNYKTNKLCTWRHNIPPPLSSPVGALAPPSRRNVAVLSHAEYVSTLQPPYALRPR